MLKDYFEGRQRIILRSKYLCSFFLVILLSALLVVLAPATNHAQEPEIALSPTNTVPVSSVTVIGTGFVPGFTATITIDGEQWGRTGVIKMVRSP
jgi:hypothetical protein